MTGVERFAGLNLADVCRSVRRYWVSSACLFLGLVACLLGGLILWPNRYVSDAQILVRLGRGSVSIDPTSSVTPTVSLQETRLTQVNSVKEMMGSRALAERVVDRVGVERVLAPQSTLEKWMLQAQSLLPKMGEGAPAGGELTAEEVRAELRREEAVKKLQGSLHVVLPKNAYTIYISVKTGSPFLSRDLVSALLDEYRDYHVDAHRANGSLEFFEQESATAYQNAIAAQEKVRDVKNRMGVLEIDSAKTALRNELSMLERDLAQVEGEIAGIQAELKDLNETVAAIPERVNSETVSGIPKQAGDGMRQQVFNLEMQERNLAAQLTEQHPKLREIREQLEESRKIATTERGEQPQSRESINPLWQQLALTQRTSEARLSGLLSKRDTLTGLLEAGRERMSQMNSDAVELLRLTWEASVAEGAYLRNAQSREQAKMLAALDREQFSEISVVQPAALVLKKVSPPRSLMAVGGTFMIIIFAGLQGVVRGLLLDKPSPVKPAPSSVVDEIRTAHARASIRRYEEPWRHDRSEDEAREIAETRSEGKLPTRALPH